MSMENKFVSSIFYGTVAILNSLSSSGLVTTMASLFVNGDVAIGSEFTDGNLTVINKITGEYVQANYQFIALGPILSYISLAMQPGSNISANGVNISDVTISRLFGLEGNIQTLLDAKAPADNPSFTGTSVFNGPLTINGVNLNGYRAGTKPPASSNVIQTHTFLTPFPVTPLVTACITSALPLHVYITNTSTLSFQWGIVDGAGAHAESTCGINWLAIA